jgi:hypothetical protein
VYVLRQNCRAAGWRWDRKIKGHYEHLEYITQEGEIIKNLNKGEFYKYLGIY